MNRVIDKLLLRFQAAGNTDEFKIDFSITMMLLAGLFIHVFFFFYYMAISVHVMFFINACSVAVYLAAIHLNRMKKHRAASIMGILEVTAYAVVATVLLGSRVYAHWLILIAFIPPFLFLDLSRAQKCVLGALMCAAINFCAHAEWFVTPPFPQDDNIVLGALNLNILLVCVLLEMGMSTIINRVMTMLQAKDVEKFKEMSYIDQLTKLYNRHYAVLFFDRLLSGALPHSSYLFVMMDIDDFKNINDVFGHETGDVILMNLANVLRDNIRQTDLVCRWGGEEFLIVMCGCTVQSGVGIMEDVRKIIEESVYLGSRGSVTYTVTCGVSPLINNSVEDTINECDNKLFQGKRSGKNSVVV